MAATELESRSQGALQVARIRLSAGESGPQGAIGLELFLPKGPNAGDGTWEPEGPAAKGFDHRPRLGAAVGSEVAPPVVLLLPMGGGSYVIERHFARFFARRGFAVVLARRGNMAPQSKIEEIDAWMEEAVRENRAVLDWIETRPDLDARRIVLFGISTGGIRGVLLSAVDPRIQASVIGLAGGDLAYILAHSTEPSIERRRKAYLREHQVDVAEFEQRLRALLRSDPSAYAPHVDCRKVLLVLAKHDTVVPIAKGHELRANLGKPETLLVPTGHYTSIFAIGRIKRDSVRFFERQLRIGAQSSSSARR